MLPPHMPSSRPAKAAPSKPVRVGKPKPVPSAKPAKGRRSLATSLRILTRRTGGLIVASRRLSSLKKPGAC